MQKILAKMNNTPHPKPYNESLDRDFDADEFDFKNWSPVKLEINNTSHPAYATHSKIVKYVHEPMPVLEALTDGDRFFVRHNGAGRILAKINGKRFKELEEELGCKIVWHEHNGKRVIEIYGSSGTNLVDIDNTLDDSTIHMSGFSDNMDFGTWNDESPSLPPIPKCQHDSKTKRVFNTFSFWQCDECKEDLGDVIP